MKKSTSAKMFKFSRDVIFKKLYYVIVRKSVTVLGTIRTVTQTHSETGQLNKPFNFIRAALAVLNTMCH